MDGRTAGKFPGWFKKNDHAGGRLWAGDILISASKYTPQVREILDELKIPYKKGKTGLSGGRRDGRYDIIFACA